jgi:hypothetical protein
VLVFIHGLHGDGSQTWRGDLSGSAVYWPCLAVHDPLLGGSGAFVANYYSRPLLDNPGIDDTARQLALDLRTQRVFEHSNVSVVAHSMGGIVLARMLTLPGLVSPEERSRIRMALFVGTPALPTDAANICSKLGINRQCEEMSDATRMATLWADWDRLPQRPSAWCVAEGANMFLPAWQDWLPSVWRRIVPEESARRPCRDAGQVVVAPGLNHADVVKPPTSARQAHRHLQAAFAACVRPRLAAAAPASAATRALSAAVARWFYDTKDQLKDAPDQSHLILRENLASEQEVNRFWFPGGDGRPSLDASIYDRLNAPSFALAVRRVLPNYLSTADVDWVRSADDLGTAIADGGFSELISRLMDSGGLRADDVVLALRGAAEPGALSLLLLRRGSSNVQAPANPRPFGLLGLLVVPRPTGRCEGAAV